MAKADKECESEPHYLDINALPDLAMLKIFSNLDFFDLCKCTRVCRRWHALSKDFSLRKTIVIYKQLNTSQLEKLFLTIAKSHYSVLREFHLLQPFAREVQTGIERNSLRKLRKLRGTLKRISLTSVHMVGSYLKDLPPSLVHLNLRRCKVDPWYYWGSDPSKYMPHITCLDFSKVKTFRDTDGLKFLASLKSLKALYLEECYLINNEAIENIRDVLPQLEVLNVERTIVTDLGFINIFEFGSNLKALFIGSTRANDAVFHQVDWSKHQCLSYMCTRDTKISIMGMICFFENAKNVLVNGDFELSSPNNCECKPLNSSFKIFHPSLGSGCPHNRNYPCCC